VTTPIPGSAGDPQDRQPTGSDPTREIELDQTGPVRPSADTQVFGTAQASTQEHPAPAAGDASASVGREEPQRPSGPHLPPVLLGIVCLAIAGLAIWQEVTDVQVDWGNVGPLGIVAIGALLVLLGLVGLLGSRRRGRTS
jgi:hypothetical protein